MKTFLILLQILTISFVRFLQNPIPPSKVHFVGNQENTLIIENFTYTTCIDTRHNIPLWVSHAISKEIIENKTCTSCENFWQFSFHMLHINNKI